MVHYVFLYFIGTFSCLFKFRTLMVTFLLVPHPFSYRFVPYRLPHLHKFPFRSDDDESMSTSETSDA